MLRHGTPAWRAQYAQERATQQQMAAARARRRAPQGRGCIDGAALHHADKPAARRDVTLAAFRLRYAEQAGAAALLADERELVARATATYGGCIGIFWGQPSTQAHVIARRRFRLAYVLLDQRGGADALARVLRHAGRAVLSDRVRVVRVLVEGRVVWGWALPVPLTPQRPVVGDGKPLRTRGYWDAPPLGAQAGYRASRRAWASRDAREERVAAEAAGFQGRHRGADVLAEEGEAATDWLVVAHDRDAEMLVVTPSEAEHERSFAVERDLAALEQELATQWAAHGVDYESLDDLLRHQQEQTAAKCAAQPRPVHPSIARWRLACAAARTAGRPRPEHPSIAQRRRTAAARPLVAAQASDADLAWYGRGWQETAALDPLLIARRRQAALQHLAHDARGNAAADCAIQQAGRAERTVAQARALGQVSDLLAADAPHDPEAA